MLGQHALAGSVEFLAKRAKSGFVRVGGVGEGEGVEASRFYVNGIVLIHTNLAGVSMIPKIVCIGR
jgi:hypothetical protein